MTQYRPQDGDKVFNADPSDILTSFGGEYYQDDGELYSEFGLDLGDLSIWNISKPQIQKLGLDIINHLLTCGYDFEFGKDENGKYLKTKE